MNTPKEPALDSVYRARWEEYHLADGTVKNSRYTNWRDVTWERVVKLVARIRNERFEVGIEPGHKAFIRFRVHGMEAQYDAHGEYKEHRPTNLWVIGWTDGETCHLQEIDFKTGALVKRYTAPLSEHKSHLHPRMQHAWQQ